MKNKIEKNRIFINLAILISLISDAFSIAILLKGGIHPSYDGIMIAIAVVDLLLFAVMQFSNPRLRSTVVFYILYAILISVAAFVLTFSYGFTYVNRLMPTLSAVIFLASHLFSALATILISVGSRFDVNHIKKGRLALRLLMSAGVTAAYVAFVVLFGFFGQGYGQRELLYSYDSKTDSYYVSGVTAGRSGNVVIPASFDGKPVTAVSATIFNDAGVRNIKIDTRNEAVRIYFDGKESFSAISSLKSFSCGKFDIDSIKQQLYDYGSDDSFALANLLVPFDLREDEVFVSFALDRELTEATGTYLKTWIRPKGTLFRLDFDKSVGYSLHTDPGRPEDLEWCYLNNNGILLNGISAQDKQLAGTRISESIQGAVLQYDRVYRVVFDADNDSKYELPANLTCDVIDGVRKNYRYVLQSRADELFDLCNRRTGFSLDFRIGGKDCPSLAEYLSNRTESKKTDVHIIPFWSMDPVELSDVTLLSGSGVASLSEIRYGDNFSLQCEAEDAPQGFSLSYQWRDGAGKDLKNDSGMLRVENILPTQAGEYTVTVTKRSAASSLTAVAQSKRQITVQPRKLEVNWTSPSQVKYNGTKWEPSLTFDQTEVINSDPVSFTILVDRSSAKEVKDAGVYQLKAKLPDSLDGKYSVVNGESTMTVLQKTAELIWDTDAFEYDGQQHRPAVIGISGRVDADAESSLIGKIRYTGAAAQNYRVNAYTVAADVSALKNYSFADVDQTFTITKREVSILARGVDEFTYNGQEQYTRVTWLGNTVAGEENAALALLDYTRTGGPGNGSSKNAGNYDVTVAFPDVCNYTFRSDVERTSAFRILPIPLTIRAEDRSAKYGDSAPAFGVDCSGFIEGENESDLSGNLRFSCTYSVGNSVGDYVITPSGLTSDNYDITFVSGNLIIGKRALTVRADNQSTVYGNDAPVYTVTYTGFAAGEDAGVLHGLLQLDCAYSAGDNVDQYTITPSGLTSENYEITFMQGVLTVAKRDLTVKAENKSTIYGDAAPGFTVTYSGFSAGENQSVLSGELRFDCAYAAGKGAGSYVITPRGLTSGNYNITFTSGTLTVGKRDLTVKAENKSTIYGDAAPAFTATYSGFVPGENESVLTGSLQFTCSYFVGQNAGSYLITPNGVTSPNYSITFHSAFLTVGKRDLTVKAENKSTIYGDAAPTFTATYIGLAVGENTNSLSASLQFSCSYNAGDEPGTYAIMPSGLTSGNYNVTYDGGTLTVGKRALTVRADNKSTVYGDAAPTFTATYSGFAFGEDENVLSGTLQLTCSYTLGGGVGSYSITPHGVSSAHYDIQFVSGVLTVEKRALTVRADNKSTVYGDAAPTFTATYSGFASGEDENVLTGTLQFTSSYETGSPAGNYPIRVSGVSSDHYSITYQDGVLTVEEKI